MLSAHTHPPPKQAELNQLPRPPCHSPPTCSHHHGYFFCHLTSTVAPRYFCWVSSGGAVISQSLFAGLSKLAVIHTRKLNTRINKGEKGGLRANTI